MRRCRRLTATRSRSWLELRPLELRLASSRALPRGQGCSNRSLRQGASQLGTLDPALPGHAEHGFVEERYAGLKVVLLHCYPFHREAAYLASVFPGAHMDLSLAIPHAAQDGSRALGEALGLCPTSKLLYASDASRFPEVYLVAAALHREALAGAMGELVEHGIINIAAAANAGRQVMTDNAKRVYNLKD